MTERWHWGPLRSMAVSYVSAELRDDREFMLAVVALIQFCCCLTLLYLNQEEPGLGRTSRVGRQLYFQRRSKIRSLAARPKRDPHQLFP